jgi:ubiquitin carboxyl-terminal hydrolase 25/28
VKEFSSNASSSDKSQLISQANLDEFWARLNNEQESEKNSLMAERQLLFEGMREVAYRLHAVVCHAGSTAAAGHYWVWIRDFENNNWRKYNDTRVSVHAPEFVFEELNTKGEPYYLAYVRADQIHELVSVPQRPKPQSQLMLSPEFEMTDAPQMAGAEHVEDAVGYA